MAIPSTLFRMLLGFFFILSGLVENVIRATLFITVSPFSNSEYWRINRAIEEFFKRQLVWLLHCCVGDGFNQSTERSVIGDPLAPSTGGDAPLPSGGSHSPSPHPMLLRISISSASGSYMLVNVGTTGMVLAFSALFYQMFTTERLKTAVFTLFLFYAVSQLSAIYGVVGGREDPTPEDSQDGVMESTTGIV